MQDRCKTARRSDAPMSARRRTVIVMIVLAQLWSGLAPAAPVWPPRPELQQRLDDALELIAALERSVPKPTLDLNDLAFEFDFDYQTAIDELVPRLRFEPYLGVLRGPEGTLAAGGGNAWDQSLLLAALIKSIGGDAQVVGGTITSADATRLLARAFEPVAVVDPNAAMTPLLGPLRERDPELATGLESRLRSAADPAARRALEQQTATLTEQLGKALAQAGIELAPPRQADALVAQLAADYAWVRWRSGPGQDWQELHPAFGALDAPTAEATRYLADEVPPELLHRIGVRLFIERQGGGSERFERIPIMDEFLRPAANLTRGTLTLGVGPLGGNLETDQVFAAPLLNGRPPAGAMAFSALGLTARAEDAASSMAALFATVGNRMAGVAGQLGGLGADPEQATEAQPRLTGVLLQTRVLGPNGTASVSERRLVDLRDRPDAPFPDAASSYMVIDVHLGRNDPQLLFHRQLDEQRAALRGSLPLLAWARRATSLDEIRREPALRELGEPSWLDFQRYADAMLPLPDAGRAALRPGPLVAARRASFDAKGAVRYLSDILHNPVTVLTRDDDGSVLRANRLALAQGVRETLLESALMGVAEGWSTRVPKRIVRDPAALDRDAAIQAWPLQAREQARQDLDAGYVLATTDATEPHWWRIDPATGQTLGMGMHGGQEMAEYIVMVLSAGLASYFFYRSVKSCDETYAGNQNMADCCIVGNLAFTYFSSGTSAAVGGLPTGEAAAWVAQPFATALGYILASLQVDLAVNMLGEAVSGAPIDAACRAYLGR